MVNEYTDTTGNPTRYCDEDCPNRNHGHFDPQSGALVTTSDDVPEDGPIYLTWMNNDGD